MSCLVLACVVTSFGNFFCVTSAKSRPLLQLVHPTGVESHASEVAVNIPRWCFPHKVLSLDF